ncbi:MAG: prolyl-tRNA synthetase associated domain-containing protein [Alphaproteobacteria bacterium]|nr:prolyl-tRNA synthetase associated domain-containing protein [Alphaproteobacteria bacterium]
MTDTAPPADLAPRTTPEQLLQRLKELGIETTTHEHPPLLTVEDSKRLRGDLPGGHCKNLFFKDKKDQYWLFVTSEDRKVDIKALDKALGAARLSFASAERLWQVLGVKPGSVTPFALINDRERKVRVFLDAAMLKEELLNYHPLVNTRTTAIRPADLVRFIEACGHRPATLNLDT